MAPFTFRGDRLGGEAAADLTGKEFHVGILDANGKIALAGANPGDVFQGIIIGEDKAGGEVGLQYLHIEYGVLGATVTQNQRLTANASGQLIPATAGQYSNFRALEARTVGGNAPAGQVVIPVLIGDGRIV